VRICHYGKAKINERSRIERATPDKGVVLEPNARIGHNLAQNRQRYFFTEKGVVVVIPPQQKIKPPSGEHLPYN
jgi:ADP-glucose pyrophosphorylase